MSSLGSAWHLLSPAAREGGVPQAGWVLRERALLGGKQRQWGPDVESLGWGGGRGKEGVIDAAEAREGATRGSPHVGDKQAGGSARPSLQMPSTQGSGVLPMNQEVRHRSVRAGGGGAGRLPAEETAGVRRGSTSTTHLAQRRALQIPESSEAEGRGAGGQEGPGVASSTLRCPGV